MSKVLYDIETKLDNANLENVNESINEDGHTDVASSKRKVMIMVDDSNKLLNKLNGMNKEDSLPSWWSDKITLSQNYLEKATNYLLNPVESVDESVDPKVKKQASTLLKKYTNNWKKLEKETEMLMKFAKKNKATEMAMNFEEVLKKLKGSVWDNVRYQTEKPMDDYFYESVNESKEPDVITQLRDIVKRKTNKKIKDPKSGKTMRVDMFTANVITQVYDAIKKNSSHKSKFESLPLDKMAQLSFKMMK